MEYMRLQTPRGVRDFLGAETAAKRSVEEAFHRTFTSWGYQEVVTPTFEFADALALGNGPDMAEKMFRFFDREGNTLALRPEMTTPIGRLVAARLRNAPKPLRFYYVANVFRYEEPRAGRGREFWQAGVEMLGSTAPAADAEVAALALQSLEATGLQSFYVDIGHVGYFHGLLAEAGLDEEGRQAIRRALLHRDYVALEEELNRAPMSAGSKAALAALPRLRGGLDVLDRAAALTSHPQAHAAVEALRAVVAVLQDYGLAHRVGIDLGMIKDLDYYTGMVLEAYADTVGFPLCTGGRYDGLLARFGYPCPATGFVATVDGIMMALNREKRARGEEDMYELPPRWLVAAADGARGAAFAIAQRLRAAGESVELDVEGLDGETLARAGRERGVQATVFVAADGSATMEGPPELRARFAQLTGQGAPSADSSAAAPLWEE